MQSDENKLRISFLSCSMICGKKPKLWPSPSGAKIEKSLENFQIFNILYQVETKFESVAKNLHEAMSIFIDDLKVIVLSSGGRIESDGNNSLGNLNVLNIILHVTETDTTLLTLDTNECYALRTSSK